MRRKDYQMIQHTGISSSFLSPLTLDMLVSCDCVCMVSMPFMLMKVVRGDNKSNKYSLLVLNNLMPCIHTTNRCMFDALYLFSGFCLN